MKIQNYYWKSEGELSLRTLIDAEKIEKGIMSLSIIVEYEINNEAFVSKETFIQIEEFTRYFSNTVSAQISNPNEAKKIKVIIIKKSLLKAYQDEQIHIYNPPLMLSKKV